MIAINALAFFIEIWLSRSPQALRLWMHAFGFVPQEATGALREGRSLLSEILMPLFTSMFLHGGWLHLIGNLWFLHIFGDNVEGRLGHAGFAAFYIICGLVAGVAHYALAPLDPTPTVGASGAIAGVLGAYIVCWPRARVLVLVPILFFFHLIEMPALIVLGMWFLFQLFGGAASLGVRYSHGGVAYGAHIGGFLAGTVLIKLWPFPQNERARRSPRERGTMWRR